MKEQRPACKISVVRAALEFDVASHYAAEECTEQRLRREVVADFLQTEQYSANRRTESHCNTAGSTGTEDLPSFTVVIVILREQSTGNITDTASDMDIRAKKYY